MTSIACETWDAGRLLINAQYAPLLRAQGLTTCAAWLGLEGGEVAKHLIRERPTVRVMLETATGPQAFYLKRLARPRLRETIKRVLHFKSPRLTAHREWKALLAFQRLGIPTMIPVACGLLGGESFLVTAALEGYTKLPEWLRNTPQNRGVSQDTDVGTTAPWPADTQASGTATLSVTSRTTSALNRAEALRQVAQLARTMHAAGWHHQDFYAGHLLVPQGPGAVHVIDLGRVSRLRFPRWVWVVKDLAQFYYSTAELLTRTEQLRLFREYLGRANRHSDRWLMRAIQMKAAAIRRHTRKHGWQS